MQWQNVLSRWKIRNKGKDVSHDILNSIIGICGK